MAKPGLCRLKWRCRSSTAREEANPPDGGGPANGPDNPTRWNCATTPRRTTGRSPWRSPHMWEPLGVEVTNCFNTDVAGTHYAYLARTGRAFQAGAAPGWIADYNDPPVTSLFMVGERTTDGLQLRQVRQSGSTTRLMDGRPSGDHRSRTHRAEILKQAGSALHARSAGFIPIHILRHLSSSSPRNIKRGWGAETWARAVTLLQYRPDQLDVPDRRGRSDGRAARGGHTRSLPVRSHRPAGPPGRPSQQLPEATRDCPC